MAKIVLMAVVVFGLVACENTGISVSKADSLKQKLDTTLDKIGDSAKAKGQRTLEKINGKLQDLGKKPDTVAKDTTNLNNP